MTVTRDSLIDKEYARLEARTARREALKRDVAKLYTSAYDNAQNALKEFLTPIKLDLVDWKYGTSLRKQYFAGKRTQQILATKRSYGL